MSHFWVFEKTWITATITRYEITKEKWEEIKTPVTIHESINAEKMKVSNQRNSENLAEITKNYAMIIKVWKQTCTQIGDFIELSQKGYGSIGRFEIDLVQPVTARGRMVCLYLYVKQTNES